MKHILILGYFYFVYLGTCCGYKLFPSIGFKRQQAQISRTEKKQSLVRGREGLLVKQKLTESDNEKPAEPSAFDQVASKGLAGVLAIACAEAIFWAAGMPLAALWVKFTTGEWIDLTSQEGQLQAAGFSFGYGGFATVILQYRVTLFAIPLVPVMEKLVVEPGKRFFGDQFGQKQ